MSKRLCKYCNKLITPDDSFRTISVLAYGYTLVVDKVTNTAHLLMSEKRTQLLLRRRQARPILKSHTAHSAEGTEK
jgi:hypothetical protein